MNPPSAPITVVLGNEYDDRILDALRETLAEFGSSQKRRFWGVAGSQEVERFEVTVDGEDIVVEAETYQGVSISGPKTLVERVNDGVQRRLVGMRGAKKV